MKIILHSVLLILLTQSCTRADQLIEELNDEEPIILVIPVEDNEQLKAGLGATFGQLLIAPTVLAQAWINQLGSNLQAVVGLLNTTHTALYVQQNATLNAHANLLANLTAAHAAHVQNHTNALVTHLDTHKEIAQNVSQAVVQAATALLNSTANLATTNYQTSLAVAQMIMNATLEARLARLNATSEAHQTILSGVGSLLEQKMTAHQFFYGNISNVIQNITNATVFDLQSHINTTHLVLEFLDNNTIIASEALQGVMTALTDAHNTSALSFVASTTVLLDTIADIVNTTHNISHTHFANHTGNLLTTVANVFDILANASTIQSAAFVDHFNSSVIAFSDAVVDLREAAGAFHANMSANFVDTVSNLMDNKTALHSNVTQQLSYLASNLTQALTQNVLNFTQLTNHHVQAATTRQASDNLWFGILGGFLENVNNQFQQTINATTNAFNQGVQAMQQQIAAVGQSAEAAAAQINAQLNSTMAQFQCTQVLIPEYIRVFASSAIRPISCSGDALANALKTAMGEVDAIREQSKIKIDSAVAEFNACRQSEDKGMTCSATVVQQFTAVTMELTRNLGTYALTGLPNAFVTAQCTLPENSGETFLTLQEKIQKCTEN